MSAPVQRCQPRKPLQSRSRPQPPPVTMERSENLASPKCGSVHPDARVHRDKGRTGLQGTEGGETAPAQHKAHCRDGTEKAVRDRWPRQPCPGHGCDLVLDSVIQKSRIAQRTRGADSQTHRARGSIAVAPLAHRYGVNPKGRHSRNGSAAVPALNHQHSIVARGAGILVQVHPGLRVRVAGVATTSSHPRTDNLHRNDS